MTKFNGGLSRRYGIVVTLKVASPSLQIDSPITERLSLTVDVSIMLLMVLF